MHVVASPVVVAVALGLLNPVALDDDEDVGDDASVIDAVSSPAEEPAPS
ncbi:MAG: hypothetical protein ACOZNI_21550 [Myxococcota bacterium]